MMSNDAYEINLKNHMNRVIKWSEEWSSKLWTEHGHTLSEKSLNILVKIPEC